jgi:hypothetical protein
VEKENSISNDKATKINTNINEFQLPIKNIQEVDKIKLETGVQNTTKTNKEIDPKELSASYMDENTGIDKLNEKLV